MHRNGSDNAESGENSSWSRLEWLLILLPAALIAFHTLQNNDLPMHLAIGDWILEHATVPDYDPFSGGVDKASWVPHEWLAGVGYSLVYRWFGDPGLIAAAVLGSLLFALLHALVLVRLGATRLGMLWWSVPLWLMAGRRLMLRPHLIALALVFLLWWLLLEARRRPRLLWFVPLVLVFWVNVHGSYYLGLGIVFCGLLLSGHEHAASWRLRGLIGALSCVALLVQPFGIEGLLHPLRLTGSEVFMQQIREWAPPFGSGDHSALFRETPAFAVSVLFIAAILAGLARRAVPLPYGLFLLATLLLYLRHQRYLALFAAAALPYAPFITSVARSWGAKWASRAVVVGFAAFLIVLGYPATWDSVRPPIRAGGVYLWAAPLPLWEVDQLLASGYRGVVLCEYHHGGVVAWRSGALLRPTMDSRNSVYGAERFLAHQQALDTGAAVELFDHAVAALVSAPWKWPQRSALHARLASDPSWLLVSYTNDYFCYVRAGAAEAGPGLDTAALRLVRPDTGTITIQSTQQLPQLIREAEFGLRLLPPPVKCLQIYGVAKVTEARLSVGDGARAALDQARRAAAAVRAQPRSQGDTLRLEELEKLIQETVIADGES
ncbi:MAG: hypothetical protein AAF581_23045 [Planctomycetota bacterium]